MRLFTILFMGALAIGATFAILPILPGLISGGPVTMTLTPSVATFLGGFWLSFARLILPDTRPLEAGGLRHTEQDEVMRIEAPNLSPWYAVFVGAVFLPVPFTILLIFVSGDGDASLPVAIVFWLLLTAAISAFPLHMIHRRRRGDFEIIVDKAAQTIDLPAMLGRKARETIPLSRIRGLTLTESWVGSGRGRRFLSTVYLTTGAREEEILAEFSHDSDSAHAFVDWMRRQLGLK